MTQSPVVYVKLPRTGLGNMLYVWARGEVLARKLGVEPVVSAWSQLHLGPILRRERSRRFYHRQLYASPLVSRIRAYWQSRNQPTFADNHDGVELILSHDSRRSISVIDRMGDAPGDDSFRDLKPHRDFLKAKLWGRLYPHVVHEVESARAACIGIHVRRGDFQNSDWFTPINYFCERLQSIRDVSGESLQATVFSDGTNEDISQLLKMTDVCRAPRRSDVADLLVLSKSRLIVASGVSTFSNWASFLSDGVIIRHPQWMHKTMRANELNQERFEGTPGMSHANWPDLLTQNIRALQRAAACTSASQ